MPDRESPADLVLDALGLAVFLRGEDGSLRLAGNPPEWLRQLWPALDKGNAQLPIADASPFFENFLIDAEECWRSRSGTRAGSGPWIEQKTDGAQEQLEATAMTIRDQQILLIKRLGEEFQAKKDVLQKARETVIAHQRLNSEIQKKEILLHCVADEMTTALSNIVTSLRLIEGEDNPPRTKQLLGLAMRGTEEQQRLIDRVLDVFAEEIGSIFGREGTLGAAAAWNAALSSALEATKGAFSEKNVRLIVPPSGPIKLEVSMDLAHLERVLSGLLENALERTPRGGEIALGFDEDPEAVTCRITDSGPRIAAAISENLFSKYEVPMPGSNAAALRLHFCRIAVESCGGEIGCQPGPTGGNSFWFRLPKRLAT